MDRYYLCVAWTISVYNSCHYLLVCHIIIVTLKLLCLWLVDADSHWSWSVGGNLVE